MSKELRPAAVAGMFYPETSSASARNVGELLSGVIRQSANEPSLRPKAVIVPHAGYVYSGPIAASAYARLAPLRGSIRRVILLGPTHRVAINGLALPASRAFATPLGQVAVDQEAIALVDQLPQVSISDLAHAQEHSLEVQLPFLQTLLGDFLLVPLAVGHASPEEVAEVLEQLWGGDETLIVISSDLSHYLPYAAARQVDSVTCEHILELDPSIHPNEACGALPINGLLLAARHHGLTGILLDLRNSGDTAGDKARVVGYGAFMFGAPLTGEEHHAH